MARDLRQLKGKNSYPDRCYYYSSTAIQGNKLVKDAQPLGRFDKRDTISFQWERPTINGMVSSVRSICWHGRNIRPCGRFKGRICLLLIIWVCYLLLLHRLLSDDANRGKVLGTRPQFKTTFKLMGLESE